LEGQLQLDREIVDNCLAEIEEHFLRRLAGYKAELLETNNAVLDIRSKSLEETWRNAKHMNEQKLQEARSKGAPTQLITRIENKLRRLQWEYEKRAAEIEEHRKVSESFKEIAAGFLRII
jgi:hypothetical protein